MYYYHQIAYNHHFYNNHWLFLLVSQSLSLLSLSGHHALLLLLLLGYYYLSLLICQVIVQTYLRLRDITLSLIYLLFSTLIYLPLLAGFSFLSYYASFFPSCVLSINFTYACNLTFVSFCLCISVPFFCLEFKFYL